VFIVYLCVRFALDFWDIRKKVKEPRKVVIEEKKEAGGMKVFVSQVHDKLLYDKDYYNIEFYPETEFERKVIEMFVAFFLYGTHWDTVYKVYRDDLKRWGYAIHIPISEARRYLEDLKGNRRDSRFVEEGE